MIQVQAAQRLRVMAAANEAQARSYIKQALGVEPGKVIRNDNNSITFELDKMKLQPAVAKADVRFKPFGARKDKNYNDHREEYSWDFLAGKRRFYLGQDHDAPHPVVMLLDFTQ